MAPAKPDRPRGLHALQCLHARLPRGRDRLRLPDRSRRSARRTATASPRAATSARSTSCAPRASGASASTSCSISRASRSSACTRRRRAISRPATIRSSRRSPRRSWCRLVGEFEKPKFFKYQEKICAHSRSGREGCTNCIDVCSSGAIRADGDHVHGRAAPVRGLRRLRHRVPVGRDDVRLSDACPTWACASRRCSPPTARRAARTQPSSSTTPATAAKRSLALGRKGKGLPARVIPLECFHVAVDRHRPSPRRARVRGEPGASSSPPRRSPPVRRSARAADGVCADDRDRPRLRGDAFQARCEDPAEVWAPRAGGHGSEARHVQSLRGEAHHARFRDRSPGAATGGSRRSRSPPARRSARSR